MGLVYDTPKWPDTLWASHVTHSLQAKRLLHTGSLKQRSFPKFSQDIHSLLYLRHEPPAHARTPEWASGLCERAKELPEWEQLRARCQANGFVAGLATEALLQELIELMPEPKSRQQPEQSRNANQTGQPDQSRQQGQPNGTRGGNGDDTRRALRRVVRQAMQTVDDASAAMEDMQEALGLTYGNSPGHSETLQDLEQVRTLYEVLRSNHLFRRIAMMAGRLQRIGARHKRTKVTPGVGIIKGIAVGGDIPWLLPTELAGLRSANKLAKLMALRRILGRQALQYQIEGVTPLGRGPVIICLDESGSMHGEPATWSKAVAMALLQTASAQRRAWRCIGFSGRGKDQPYKDAIRYNVQIDAGQASLDTILSVLSFRCDGGTDFVAPLHFAIEALHSSPAMRQSDVIFITDGAGQVTPDIIEQVNVARKRDQLHVYVIGIGKDARLETLRPIADEMYHLSGNPDRDSQHIAPALALVD